VSAPPPFLEGNRQAASCGSVASQAVMASRVVLLSGTSRYLLRFPYPVHGDAAAARDDGQIRPLQVAQFLGAQPGVQRRDEEGPVAWGAMCRDRREQRGLFLVAEVAGRGGHARD